MDKVESAVIRYLKSYNPFALQINGPWGSGKTYFVEHDIIPFIKNNKIHNKRYIPIYISLNSIGDISTLKSKLCNALLLHNKKIYNTHTKRLWLWIKSIFKITKSDLYHRLTVGFNAIKDNIINDYLNKKHIVLIFDDLERTNNIKFLDLLGYFSNIINIANIKKDVHHHKEYPKCKIIIISNEEKIKDVNKNNVEFKKSKERVISKTLGFNRRFTRNIAKQILFNNVSWIRNNVDDIWLYNVTNFMIQQLKNVNLRTILSITYTLNSFFDSLYVYYKNNYLKGFNKIRSLGNYDVKKYFKLKLERIGYVTIFVLTDVIKRDKNINMTYLYKNNYFRSIINKNFNISNKNSLKFNKDDYLRNIFYNTYFREFDYNSIYVRDIYKLITKDDFNINSYVKNIYHLLFRKNLESKVMYSILSNKFRYMNDEEIREYEFNIVVFMNADSDINFLIKVYSLLYKFKQNNIIVNQFYIYRIKILIFHKLRSEKKIIDLKLKNSINNISDKDLVKHIQDIIKYRESRYDAELHLAPILNGNYSELDDSWLSDHSIFGSISYNSELQNRACKGSGSVNLQKYLVSETDNKRFRIHEIEINYARNFILLLKNIMDKGDIDSMNRFNLIKLIDTVKNFYSSLLQYRNKHINDDLPF